MCSYQHWRSLRGVRFACGKINVWVTLKWHFNNVSQLIMAVEKLWEWIMGFSTHPPTTRDMLSLISVLSSSTLSRGVRNDVEKRTTKSLLLAENPSPIFFCWSWLNWKMMITSAPSSFICRMVGEEEDFSYVSRFWFHTKKNNIIQFRTIHRRVVGLRESSINGIIIIIMDKFQFTFSLSAPHSSPDK